MSPKQQNVHFSAGLLTVALFLAACLHPSLSVAVSQPSPFLKKTILSLSKARDTVYEKQVLNQGSGNQSATQKRDVLLFISYLDGRINHYCRELYLSDGIGSLDDLPCSLDQQGNFADVHLGAVPEISGQTNVEKMAQLDRDLSHALGEFDDMLLKEQEKVAANIPRRRASSSSAAGEGGGTGTSAGGHSAEGQSGKTTQPGESGTREGDDPGTGRLPGTADGVKGFGEGRPGQSKLPPTAGREQKDLSQEDDDIVARQLREAAEQETDPEVKEKLWQEYRKYKEGI